MPNVVPGEARFVPAPRDELCLEFADTRYRRGREQATETLNALRDLLAWCELAKSLDRQAASRLDAWAHQRQSEADCLFAEAISARETIYALFSASAAGKAVAGRDVDALNGWLADAPAREALTIAKDGNMWRLPPAEPTAASLLAPVLWSAGDLFVGDRLPRVRLCANERCGWLFLDDSKSGTRRWCSMGSCGNRAKAHRHYLRKTNPQAKPAD